MLPHARAARVVAVDPEHLTLDLDGTTLTWPNTDALNASVGDDLYLLPLTKESLEAERDAIATTLLNNVLTPSHEVGSEGK